MLKYNETTLKKIEELFKYLEYKVRYEKGQFQAGYCLVKSQKVIVINKFYTTEVRINTLLEILKEVIDVEQESPGLPESLQSFWEELIKEIKPVSTKK